MSTVRIPGLAISGLVGLVSLLAVACGPNLKPGMTAQDDDEFLREQEIKGDELKREELEELEGGVAGETDLEENRKFDDEHFGPQAKRKSQVVQDCPASARAEKFQGGKFSVNIMFSNDGKTKQVTVNPKPENAELLACIKAAFNISLKPYTGPEQSRDHEFTLPSYAEAMKAQEKAAKSDEKKK